MLSSADIADSSQFNQLLSPARNHRHAEALIVPIRTFLGHNLVECCLNGTPRGLTTSLAVRVSTGDCAYSLDRYEGTLP